MSEKTVKNKHKKTQNAVKGIKAAQEGAKGIKSTNRKVWPVWALVMALVVIIGGGILFVGAVSGWFSGKVTLDKEYYTTEDISDDSEFGESDGDGSVSDENEVAALTDGDFIELLTPERYQELIQQGKSFAVFIDQDGCTTADRVRQFVTDYSKDTGVKLYRMMFADVKETELKGQVKYYPSLVVVSKGAPVKWLEADSEADADAYNDYDAFKDWISDIINAN